MLTIVNDLVSMVYDLAGDYGLAYFLVIVVVNIYYVYWYLPRKIRASATIKLAEARKRIINVKIYFGFPSLLFGIFTTAIIITQGPVLWVKVFASIVSFILVLCILISVWLYIRNRFSSLAS